MDRWMNGRVHRMKKTENTVCKVEKEIALIADLKRVCVFLSLLNALHNRLHFISHSRPHIRTRSKAISIHFIFILSLSAMKKKRSRREEVSGFGTFEALCKHSKTCKIHVRVRKRSSKKKMS